MDKKQNSEQFEYSIDSSNKEHVFLTMLEAYGFHPTLGMRYCMNDIDFYAEMLEEFARNSDERISKLNKHFFDEDINNYRIIVHTLKSSLRSIGCEDLSDYAKLLEDSAKRNDCDYIRKNHERLIDMLQNIVNGINTSLGFFRS